MTPTTPVTEPYEIEVRERDALKGPEPPGLTRAQWDVRYLLDVLDRLRAEATDEEVARLRDALEDANRYIRAAITPTVATADWTGSTRKDAEIERLRDKDAEIHAAHEHRREVEEQADATIVALEAEIARLREAGEMVLRGIDGLEVDDLDAVSLVEAISHILDHLRAALAAQEASNG